MPGPSAPTSWVDIAPAAAPAPSSPPERYSHRPVLPAAQMAARVGLWAAVALGCLGGCVGILRPTEGPAAPVAATEPTGDDVPAPVSGTAERAVTAWLTADDEDGPLLDALYLDPPSLSDSDTRGLEVTDVSTVTGRRVDDGYWAVVVAADVQEPPPSTGDADSDAEAEPLSSTWFVEIGVVGDVDGGLSALETPSIVPPPPAADRDWLPDRDGADTPAPDDPLVATVEGFLSALLVGRGDPARYVAPGLDVTALDPAPFTELVVLEIAVDRLDDTTATVWTQIQVTTPGGARQVVAYDMTVARRADRWEIRELPGVAAAAGRGPGASSTTSVPAGDAPDEERDTPAPTGEGSSTDVPPTSAPSASGPSTTTGSTEPPAVNAPAD